MYENQGHSNRSSYSGYPRYKRRGGSFKRKNFKKIAIIALTIFLIAALVAGGISLFSTKAKTVLPHYSVGGLDLTDGKYVETTDSIYTTKAFDCIGLTVKVANDADITYRVFFYDEVDNFISVSEELSRGSALDVPGKATQARIMITPDWDKLNADTEESEEETENIIKWYEVSKYANILTITVSRDQAKATRIVNLSPSAKWREDNSLYAIYYWNAEGSQFVILSDTDGDGIYTFEMPEGYHNYLFVDLLPNVTEATWDNVRDQTGNFYAE